MFEANLVYKTISIGAVAIFLGRWGWEYYWKLWQEHESIQYRKRLDILEQQLSRFYWPIYIRLQKDNAIWDQILHRKEADPFRAQIGYTIEEKVLLPNHQETVKIIQENIYLAQADQELENLLLQYIRHIAVYAAIRDSGCKDKDPVDLNEPWPSSLYPAIAKRTKQLQGEFDQLIKQVTALKKLRII